MSKYRKRGAYHFLEYADATTVYHHHVRDVLNSLEPHIEPGMKVLDAGCGEGLFVKLLRDNGIDACGMDTDPFAVSLAAEHGLAEFVQQQEFRGNNMKCDAILMLDSLEHMQDWRLVLQRAADSTELLVIAVPDRHDPHGINQMLGNKILDFLPSLGAWVLVHADRRYARDFFIFRKDP